jgi:hypothetical protein
VLILLQVLTVYSSSVETSAKRYQLVQAAPPQISLNQYNKMQQMKLAVFLVLFSLAGVRLSESVTARIPACMSGCAQT